MITELAETLDPDHVERFYTLMQQDELSPVESKELAEIVQALYEPDRGELAEDDTATIEGILRAWNEVAAIEDEGEDDFDAILPETETESSDLQAAGIFGFLKKLDPRQLVLGCLPYAR